MTCGKLRYPDFKKEIPQDLLSFSVDERCDFFSGFYFSNIVSCYLHTKCAFHTLWLV